MRKILCFVVKILAVMGLAVTEGRSQAEMLVDIIRSSRYLEQTGNPIAGTATRLQSAVARTALARPDFFLAIYDGRWGDVPVQSVDDLRYWARSIGALQVRCPSLLRGERAAATKFAHVTAGAWHFTARVMRGQLREGELWDILWPMVNPSRPERVLAVPLQMEQAAQDVNTLVAKYGCTSPETTRFADNLLAFAETMPYNSTLLPSTSTEEGRLYADMIRNCQVSLWSKEKASGWCQCYAERVFQSRVTPFVLKALASNPFADHRTYLWPLFRINPEFPAELRKCGDSGRGVVQSPRTTACLIETRQTSTGKTECVYQSAVGKFTFQKEPFAIFEAQTAQNCYPSLVARAWGSQEINCNTGQVAEPRLILERVNCNGVCFKYDGPLPPHFGPPLTDWTRDKMLFRADMRNQKAPRGLYEMEISNDIRQIPRVTEVHSTMMMVFRDYAALNKAEQQSGRPTPLFVHCKYNEHRQMSYWYEQVPPHFAAMQQSLRSNAPDHPLLAVQTAVKACPALAQ